jgi:hypothetical protein
LSGDGVPPCIVIKTSFAIAAVTSIPDEVRLLQLVRTKTPASEGVSVPAHGKNVM